MSEVIQQFSLVGHKHSVLCLAHSSSTPTGAHHHAASSPPSSSFFTRDVACLLSGSEDGTARLWDLRAPFRASLCIVAGGPVTSVAFAPPLHPEAQILQHDPMSPFSRNCIVYLSVGNQLRGYDLRRASGPIVTDPQIDLTQTLSCPDEINQIDVVCRRSRNSKLHLVVGEDGGSIRSVVTRVDGTTEPPVVLWHDDEDRMAMTTSVVYRPKAGGMELASGGTDCTVHLWEVPKKRKPSSSFHIVQDTSGANQICNPPMVHCLSWSPSGRLLVAGLGDGTCSVLRVGRGSLRLTEVMRLRDGHDASVASVVFPAWYPSASHRVASQDRLLATAGTDGAIFLWDLGGSVAEDGAVDPMTCINESMVSRSTSSLAEDVERKLRVSVDDTAGSDAKLLFGIPHGRKANWMVTSHGLDPVFPSTLFVADTSNDITAYTIPMR